MGWGQEKSTMSNYSGSARNAVGIRVPPPVTALCCQPGPCPMTVGWPGSPHTAWQWWVPDYAEFIPRGLRVWIGVHTQYLVTSSDISTVLPSTQGPWAVTPLSGWSSSLKGSHAPALWFSSLKERHYSLCPGNISFETRSWFVSTCHYLGLSKWQRLTAVIKLCGFKRLQL